MYFLAYALVLLAFLCSLGASAWIVLLLVQGRTDDEAAKVLRLPEWANAAMFGCLLLASGILTRALVVYDFSVVYVASYTDRLLPLFYRLTAFWGGQDGSLLFWALSVALFGTAFQMLPRYARIGTGTRLWYWLFYFMIMAFFCLVLTTWSNPFAVYAQAPADGRGLNPLLQNPGMIFHPPLLFLGYGGFVIPGCLALGQSVSGGMRREDLWADTARPFTLLAWAFLTAGIVLGAWWSYMELGWGGYWAWDPVENASLIPWLLGTAAMHTLIIQTRRDKLHQTNVLLMALTTVSAFFATYLVRSGVVQSLHAFGESGVGLPLLIFVLLGTGVSVWCARCARRDDAQPLADLETREGFVMIAVWVLLALSTIVLLATLAPVFSSAIVGTSIGLDAGFYNTVCLPLFSFLTVLLVICPWLRWKGGVRDVRRLGIAAGVFTASGSAFWGMGYTNPVAAISMAASLGVLIGCLFMLTQRQTYAHRPFLAAAGVHLGVALMVLGVAFSGPYKVERQVVLRPGEQAEVGAYTATLKGLHDDETKEYGFVRAEIHVTRQGKAVGQALPERRHYFKWGRTFAEASTIPAFGNEFYASLLSVDNDGRATLLLSIHPLVNWVWIGGTLMCLFPLLGLARRAREDEDAPNAAGSVNSASSTRGAAPEAGSRTATATPSAARRGRHAARNAARHVAD